MLTDVTWHLCDGKRKVILRYEQRRADVSPVIPLLTSFEVYAGCFSLFVIVTWWSCATAGKSSLLFKHRAKFS